MEGFLLTTMKFIVVYSFASFIFNNIWSIQDENIQGRLKWWWIIRANCSLTKLNQNVLGFFCSMQYRMLSCFSYVDCSSIIWTLDDADPVVLGVGFPCEARASLHSVKNCLNKTSVYDWKDVLYIIQVRISLLHHFSSKHW